MTNSNVPDGFDTTSNLPKTVDQVGGVPIEHITMADKNEGHPASAYMTPETQTHHGKRKAGLMEPHQPEEGDMNISNFTQVGAEPVPREILVSFKEPIEIIPHWIDGFNRGLIGIVGSYMSDLCSLKDWYGTIDKEKPAVINRLMQDVMEYRRCELIQDGDIEEVIDNVYKVNFKFIALTKAIYIPALNDLTEAKIVEEDRTYVFTFEYDGDEGRIVNLQRKKSEQRDGDQNYEWNFTKL